MSQALLPPDADAAPLLLNKRELASATGVSVVTITNYLDRYPDFPVVQAGTNGREWQFDVFAVRAFLEAEAVKERTADARRHEAIAQLGLALVPGAEDKTVTLAPQERLAHLRALKAEDDLRIQRGFLVSVPELRQVQTAAIAKWNGAVHAAIRQASRDFNLPDAVGRALVERIAEAQRAFVRELQAEAGMTDANRQLV